jgi:molybdenum cofactor guanylyltransferase
MGRDKALLELDGRPLVALAMEKLRVLGLKPRICGSQPALARFGELIHDDFPQNGPVAGIVAGLAASKAPLSLFLAVDMPLVPVEFLRWMIERAEASDAVATIPVAGGREQPLCAIYSRRLLNDLRNAIAAGHLKMMTAVTEATAALDERIDVFQVESVAAALPLGTWSMSPPLQDWFLNANTPEEFARITAQAGK